MIPAWGFSDKLLLNWNTPILTIFMSTMTSRIEFLIKWVEGEGPVLSVRLLVHVLGWGEFKPEA